MDWLNALVDKLAEFMRTKLDFLNLGGDLSPAVYIAAAGAIGVARVFIALIANASGKAKKFLQLPC